MVVFGFSLAVWGYKELSNRVNQLDAKIETHHKEIQTEIKDLRSEMNTKFEKQTAMLLEAIKRR